ncbi:hypothetical protein [Bacillus sp. B15-48]|uniref:hypothetical protein n=1 Tax=Bacillus sp. B15-48 TaxID=1548601 RepID=UPI00193EC88E|nr:hypothetical protein [Bacillus sp. B15-48]MBM4763696.1 hypothetical protein [Bacillus sp. B15-48]
MLKKAEDRLARVLEYQYPPKKIVSICPGITETLFALQLENEIIGITRYCILAVDKVKAVTKVGGTKQIKED